jgi:hypothetical protein
MGDDKRMWAISVIQYSQQFLCWDLVRLLSEAKLRICSGDDDVLFYQFITNIISVIWINVHEHGEEVSMTQSRYWEFTKWSPSDADKTESVPKCFMMP